MRSRISLRAARRLGIRGLRDPKCKGRMGIAKLLFGTIGAHVRWLPCWNDEKAKDYYSGSRPTRARSLREMPQVHNPQPPPPCEAFPRTLNSIILG